jgi:hypothetical protein
MKMDEAAIRALEERAFNAWPALRSAYCDGWLFRFSEGLTRRANSVNAVAPAGSFLETLDLAEALYGRQRLPTIFRLSPLAGNEPDATLHRAGYRHVDETHVMTAALGENIRVDPDVEIEAQPSPSWSAGFAAANGISPTMRGVHDRMLASILMPAGYATVFEAGKPLAYGLAVVERGMVGLIRYRDGSRGKTPGNRTSTREVPAGLGKDAGRLRKLPASTWAQRCGTAALRWPRLCRSLPVSLPSAGLTARIRSRYFFGIATVR